MFSCRKILVILLAAFLTGGATPAYAQKNLPKVLKQLFFPKKTLFASLFPRRQPLPGVNWHGLEPIAFAQLSTQQALRAAAPLFDPPASTYAPRPLLPAPKTIRQAVFTLQQSPQSHGKGSAFAVEIDGQIWGVTARHVLDDIGRSPFMALSTPDGKQQLFQVFSAREGNILGADVAIFRIPAEALPYVKPLKPDYRLPSAQETVQSAGFSHGNFGWFPQVDVLFASSHRILARYDTFPVRSGYCGSPILHRGKVLGVFVGITPNETAQKTEWFSLLSPSFSGKIHSFTRIAPMSWVRRLTLQERPGSHAPEGAPLKLFGKTVALLHPDETVQSVVLVRDGILVSKVPAYPFMNYNHLEAFLDVRPNDQITVVVQKGDRSSSQRKLLLHTLDLASGTISHKERK